MLKKYNLTFDDGKDNIPISKDKNNVIYLTTNKGVQSITNLNNNFIVPFIKKDMNNRTYIAGNSGCGKSYYIKKYIKAYKKLYPDQDIFLFSILHDDKTLADIDDLITRIDINNIEDFEIKDFKDCLAIFDDYVGLPAKQQKILNYYKDTILKTGRHAGIDIITCNDKLLGGVHSIKDILHSQYVVVFPQTGGNKTEIKNFLKNKLSYTDTNINKIINNKSSRWVAICKAYPYHVITENEVYMVDN
jgi:hypothetical protein